MQHPSGAHHEDLGRGDLQDQAGRVSAQLGEGVPDPELDPHHSAYGRSRVDIRAVRQSAVFLQPTEHGRYG